MKLILVCKERQLVKQQCNRTHDQLCECAPGYHLVVEFCIAHSSCAPGYGVKAAGTPVSDTVCEHCPVGHFSASDSSTEPCRPHKNCSNLGFKTLRWGTSVMDTLCATQDKAAMLECSHHHTLCHNDLTLCEEAVYQSLSSLRLSSVPLERLLESLPGRKVDRKSLERLKKTCSPQQQVLQLLRLWRERNKDQDKLYGIIRGVVATLRPDWVLCLIPCTDERVLPGVHHCERKVSRCNSLKNLTLNDLLIVADSLPGVRVGQEDVLAVVSSCLPRQYILQLLHLWQMANYDLDLAKGLFAQSEGKKYLWTLFDIAGIYRLVLADFKYLLLVLLPPFALCGFVVDSIPTYEHLDPSTGKTLLCDKCRPGTHLAAHCTPSTPTKCLPCEENQFTELWNYLPRCLYCSNYCDDSQEVAKECSATNDRVCRCKEGLYSSSGFCFSHSECQPGLGSKSKERQKRTRCVNAVSMGISPIRLLRTNRA
ncbi:unnamed protein product [Tetraodon nigroviridis]|uniref:(spotted green pufferfish) hypothetical protein n=1 Tax=Tetraodon nigroviridis TaxID=99883 RepID=Q4SH87_TETNG|nr:unnamed protein product [Tetraodon nigroviridis]